VNKAYATDILVAETDYDAKVSCIGPAGKNQVLFFKDEGRHQAFTSLRIAQIELHAAQTSGGCILCTG